MYSAPGSRDSCYSRTWAGRHSLLVTWTLCSFRDLVRRFHFARWSNTFANRPAMCSGWCGLNCMQWPSPAILHNCYRKTRRRSWSPRSERTGTRRRWSSSDLSPRSQGTVPPSWLPGCNHRDTTIYASSGRACQMRISDRDILLHAWCHASNPHDWSFPT